MEAFHLERQEMISEFSSDYLNLLCDDAIVGSTETLFAQRTSAVPTSMPTFVLNYLMGVSL